MEKSLPVSPPLEWVVNVSVTLFQRMSMSGWWSSFSAFLAIRFTKSIPLRKPANSNLLRIARPRFDHFGTDVSRRVI